MSTLRLASKAAQERKRKEEVLAREYYSPEGAALARERAQAEEVTFPDGVARNPAASEERECVGLCGFTVPNDAYATLRTAHNDIMRLVKTPAGWNGDSFDERVRMYGVLPGKLGLLKKSIDFCMRETADDARHHQSAVAQSRRQARRRLRVS